MKNLKQIVAVCLTLVCIFSPNVFAISIPDEQKLGNEYMQIIEDSGLILHDPVVTEMINTVGNHIVEGLPVQPFKFDFNLINDNSFNAFASPAANIFVHRGLIVALDNIDEFAGIMAHEVAHAASRHVSQSIDRSKMVSIGSMAGMLAGVLLGAAGGGGDAAQALTIGSVAAGQSSMLAFTRENETEADQKAVLFMEKTGYYPQGLLTSLIKIRETDYQGVEGIPDYFKTHPGTGTRISHLAGLLEGYTPSPDKPKAPKNYDFQMVKYRVIGLYSNPKIYIPKIELELEFAPNTPALHYGLGLLYARINQIDEGIDHLNKALAENIFDPMILLELGRLHIRNTDYVKAISVLKGVTDDKVLGDHAIYLSAVAQIEIGNIAAAEKGLERILSSNSPGLERANYHMANIMSRKGQDPMSHYYLGVYYSTTRDVKNAFRHLNRAIETLEDENTKQKAQKQLESVKEKAKRISKQQRS
ncbi:MAG: M48 family metalloprotease [Desulfobacterales bacterium]|nr:M48 family metalloprotease [Desulfobacterales bacterium]